jgi:hypothetical protein
MTPAQYLLLALIALGCMVTFMWLYDKGDL